MLMGKALGHSAERHPDKTAIIFEDRSWTYGQFNRRVNRLCWALGALGLSKGDKVAVLALNGPEYLEIYHACAKLGVWMVPVNYRLKSPEVGYRLAHSRASAMILGPEYLLLFDSLEPEIKRAVAGRILVLGQEPPPVGMASYEQMLASGGEQEPEVNLSPEDVLFIGYTGGTTGRSKGALTSNRAIVAGYLYKVLDYGLGTGEVTLNPGPFWHTAPRNFSSLALYMGGTTVIMRSFDPREYLRLVARHRVSYSFLVPTMFSAILGLPDHQEHDTSSLKVLMSGGSPLPTPVKEAALKRFGAVLHEFYAATETLIVTSIGARDMNRKIRSVGRPVWDAYVKLLDDRGKPVPQGQVGEIYMQCPSIFSGYYRDPDKTAAAFKDGWFTLGDMGRLDDEGFLYIVDRRTDMVISGGENIYPSEVEEVLLGHPKIAEVAVVGVPDDKWGETLKAVVVLKPGEESSYQEIATFCADKLADYLKPRSVDFVSELPRSPVGKVLKRKLRDQYWGDAEFKV
ncbi:MAG: AMP-binding protein [Desulfarculaceae bacterium]|nr:AMP-binding protein [Desulfarculaceae bacterium]MCF8072695.1 AMP-binding protein [Desulfarculaceae bacterium]MCF8102574.1 AMP-binding protein [Desulfarculaceae bacterium]MCF8116483.1 AMP-binding protein [Desulfarculaceae bacterium]